MYGILLAKYFGNIPYIAFFNNQILLNSILRDTDH
jgi:hypothetical protein